MFRLDHFGLSDLIACTTELRAVGDDPALGSMEAAANLVVQYLYDHFLDKETGDRSCALVRFYRTLDYERLPDDLQDFARASTDPLSSLNGVQCLTLLSTIGDEPAWGDRRTSAQHRCIPIATVEALEQMPMISQLVSELGITAEEVVDPTHAAGGVADGRGHGIFFVPVAVDSPSIPAQESFVLPHGIRSVVGFGGVLPDGSLFSVILFSRTAIPKETAQLFSAVSLSVKLAILPFVNGRVFEDEPLPESETSDERSTALALRQLRSENATMRQLLDVRADAASTIAARLEQAVEAERNRADEVTAIEGRRRAMIDAALDAIVMMDHRGLILEFSPVAEEIFGHRREDVIGHRLADVMIPPALQARHERGLQHYLDSGEGPVLGRRIEITGIRSDGTEFPVEVAISTVEGESPPVFTGYLRDITDRREAQQKLLESRNRLAHVAHTLQRSLLPPVLPAIPGFEIAARYVPAGSDGSGDFYDVFATGPNDWTVLLGDVCGKGAEAATVTALARYTARGAALSARKPKAVMRVLNNALLRDDSDRFCTLVYGRLQTKNVAAPTVTIASGGHPPALLLRAAVGVTEVSPEGALLGIFEKWEGAENRLTLSGGDLLFLYSDGLTEARRDGEQFGDERLRSAIAACVGWTADQAADHVMTQVAEFQRGDNKDDIALLVLRVLDPP